MLSVFLIAIRVDTMTSCIRANKNAADTFNNVQAGPDGLPPYSAEGQHKTHQDSVKRSDRKQTYQTYPQPLPTGDGGLSPARRVHVRGKDPQPNVEEAVPQQTKVRTPVVVKKIETQLSSSTLHPDRQDLTCNYGSNAGIMNSGDCF